MSELFALAGRAAGRPSRPCPAMPAAPSASRSAHAHAHLLLPRPAPRRAPADSPTRRSPSTAARRSASSARTAAASRACWRWCSASCSPMPAASRCPSQLVVAHVAQELDASDRAGDRVRAWTAMRNCARPKRRSPPPKPSNAGAALGELHARYAALGGYDARSRAGQTDAWTGFLRRRRNAAGERVLRRLARAPQCRAGADVPLRSAAARRADQSPRPGCGPLAGRVAAQLSGHAADDRARSRVPRSHRRTHRAHRERQRRASTPATTPRSRSSARRSSRSSSRCTSASSARSAT